MKTSLSLALLFTCAAAAFALPWKFPAEALTLTSSPEEAFSDNHGENYDCVYIIFN